MRDVKISLVGYGIVGHGVVDVLSIRCDTLRMYCSGPVLVCLQRCGVQPDRGQILAHVVMKFL